MSTREDHSNILSTAVRLAMQEDIAGDFENTVSTFREFMLDIPDSTSAYLNYKPREVYTRRLPPKLKPFQFEIALQLWDLHSFLCSILLTTIWRADQLKDAVISSLNERTLITGASAARALFETACAFYVESNDIISDINNAKTKGIYDAVDATELRENLQRKALRITMGTRQKAILKEYEKFSRTNIMTLISKALKNLGLSRHMDYYEKLCDAVHPSFESFSSFIDELGVSEELSQLRWNMNRYALRPKEIIDTIGMSTTWALGRLLYDFNSFYSMCIDLCLSARIPWIEFEVPVTYYGLCTRPDLYSPCPCGSGVKWKFCEHSLNLEKDYKG